ncbi:1-acyl-sn-glycerol-3-phosphate acyltransferase [Planctomicrobium sp. SH527]|uniref:1-acyl-sn-glycerol-3-phosphate acyltransferase n=1 Tax=Planctomicrobium sp. SH527 TaxID=3448123 RepID=UPI003F5BC5B8
MNPQPYDIPPQWWPSLLSSLHIRLMQRRRLRELREQGIREIDVKGADSVVRALKAGQGVLLISNHSFHYDSHVLIEAGLRGGWHPQIMTSWQVFMMYGRLARWSLQKHGCFSVNREATDSQAIRHAVSLLTTSSHPLAIYPEGDIYHANDRIKNFREGAAGIALMAARQKKRPIVVIPCAMKCVYTSDPTSQLIEMMGKLEARLGWRPTPERPLLERISRFGNGLLSLKELEYLGGVRSGTVSARLGFLANAVLEQVRQRGGFQQRGHDLTDQVRSLRSQVVRQIDSLKDGAAELSVMQKTADRQAILEQRRIDLMDLFFVTQLSSYHGDYVSQKPTVERLAETVDRYEEDVFALQAPSPRATRRAMVRFGEPKLVLPQGETASQLTLLWERSVQELLDEMNREHDHRFSAYSPAIPAGPSV